MVKVEFTDAEAAALLDLTDKAGDQLSNNGCNDYPLPNTDENWALNQAVRAWSGEKEGAERPGKGHLLYFYDWMLLAYLRGKIKRAKDEQ